MPPERFGRSFTQQEPISEAAIEAAVAVMRSGRLHRYNTGPGETAEAALLERDFAAYQGASFCLACASGGYAMQLALRAFGIADAEPVLTNAFTLSPVPGAIHAAGGRAVVPCPGPCGSEGRRGNHVPGPQEEERDVQKYGHADARPPYPPLAVAAIACADVVQFAHDRLAHGTT